VECGKLGKPGGLRTMQSLGKIGENEAQHAAGPQLTRKHGYTLNMPEDVGTSAHSAREVRCVVWHLPAAELKPELRAALARPGFSVLRCDDKFAAMAHTLTLVAGAQSSGTKPNSTLVILVLVEPRLLDDVLGLVLAMSRYAPSVIVWMYDSGGGGGSGGSGALGAAQLRAVRSADLNAWRAMSKPLSATAAGDESASAVEAGPDAAGIQAASRNDSNPSSTLSPNVPTETAGAVPLGMEEPHADAPASPEVHVVKRKLNDDELATLLDIEPPEDDKNDR